MEHVLSLRARINSILMIIVINIINHKNEEIKNANTIYSNTDIFILTIIINDNNNINSQFRIENSKY